jgi:hypothetical protein
MGTANMRNPPAHPGFAPSRGVRLNALKPFPRRLVSEAGAAIFDDDLTDGRMVFTQ